ncbi:hypothetical protein DSM104443_00266 [Usitatibacter rugosus]|uniref:Uncharacterized protein n=2 Tax=Usitatibacter rugosus TaxID=2732067 RepID=A0A6M4GPG6_9PROT|nr:hypothetical protein DSM104443_00266 [Usitatibacter rugosus]
MLAIMAIGVAVASIGYLMTDANPCSVILVVCSGFFITGLGLLVGGLTVAREWRILSVRFKFFAVGCLVSGIGLIGIIARLAMSLSTRC